MFLLWAGKSLADCLKKIFLCSYRFGLYWFGELFLFLGCVFLHHACFVWKLRIHSRRQKEESGGMLPSDHSVERSPWGTVFKIPNPNLDY